jgi:hypothetical protein
MAEVEGLVKCSSIVRIALYGPVDLTCHLQGKSTVSEEPVAI